MKTKNKHTRAVRTASGDWAYRGFIISQDYRTKRWLILKDDSLHGTPVCWVQTLRSAKSRIDSDLEVADAVTTPTRGDLPVKTVKTNSDIFHNRVAATIEEAKKQFEKAKSQFLDSAQENPSWAIERYGFWVSQAEQAFRSIKRLELFLAAVGVRYETQKEAVQACLDEEREVLIRGAVDSLSSDAVINGVALAQRHGVADAVRSLEYLVDHEFIDAQEPNQ